MDKKREIELCWDCDRYEPQSEAGCELRSQVLRGMGSRARVTNCSFFTKASVKVTKAPDNE